MQCAGPRPTVGSGVARVALAQLVSMVVFECFGQRQRTALTPPPPAQTLPCVSQMHFQASVKWKAEGWGGSLGSVGGSC